MMPPHTCQESWKELAIPAGEDGEQAELSHAAVEMKHGTITLKRFGRFPKH
jgi:hypothetical protein